MQAKPVNVLLVEDNPVEARLLREGLKDNAHARFSVTHVERLSDALQRLGQERFDVVLADLSLPDSHGLETFQRLHAGAPAVAMVVLSGHDDQTMAVTAVREGAQDYLVKGQTDAHTLTRAITYAMERHRTELALQEGERHYKHLVESLTDYFYTVRVEKGQPVESRHMPGCIAVTGYRPEEYVADANLWYRMIHEDDRDAVIAQVDRVLAGESPPPLEHRIVRKDGRVRWVRNTIVPTHNVEGALLAYDGLISDITDRKLTEEKLVASEAFYHSLVENLPQNILRKDLHERFTFANQRFCALLGKSLEEIIGRTDFDFYPADLAAKYQRDDRFVMETGRLLDTVEENQRPDGEKLYVHVIKTPIVGETGRIIGLQGIFWDITALKREEQALARERYLLDTLMNNVPDSIYFKDASSRFLRINIGLARRLGLIDPTEAVGKSDFDFFARDHAQPALDDEQQVMSTGEPIVGKVEKEVWVDGREKWVLTTKMPLRDRSGSIVGTFGLSRDITERKLFEEKLQRANEELARKEAALRKSHEDLKAAQQQLIQAEKMESMGTLAAGVAHEVKNPLAILMMGVSFLNKKLTGQDENVDLVLKEMRDAIGRADTITRGLLDFSASRQLAIKPEDMNGVVDETLRLVRHQLNENKVTLVKQWGADLPRVRMDKNRIQQVFVNLFVNAIHAMPNGGTLTVRTYHKHLTETTHFEGSRKADHFWVGDSAVVTEVDDTGCGISEEHLAKIGDPFFTTKPTGIGTGLGLAVSRKIIELHGGTIDIKNRKEGGVRVTLMLKAERG